MISFFVVVVVVDYLICVKYNVIVPFTMEGHNNYSLKPKKKIIDKIKKNPNKE